MRFVWAFLGFAVLLHSEAGTAKPKQIKSRRQSFDIPLLSKLTDKSDLALIESHANGKARQVIVFTKIHASRRQTYQTIMDVQTYPSFLPTLEETRIINRKRASITFDWEFSIPIMPNLKGRRLQRGRAPFLVETRGIDGNFRFSKERWELFKIDEHTTLAAFYRCLDMESAGFLLRTMVKLEPAMEHGATLAVSFMHVTGLKRHLEGLPPLAPKANTGPVPRFVQASPPSDLRSLQPLLHFGQMAIIDSHEDGSLKQVALVSLVDAPSETLADIVRKPETYPEFIPNFAEQMVTRLDDRRLKLEYELDVPLKNIEGESIMTFEKDGSVDVLAVDGDIRRGRWRWEFQAIGPQRSMPIHYAYSDVREASWATRLLVKKQPLFEHGIVVASGVVGMTTMKARAEGRR